MSRATGQKPRLWGSIIGFGQYHYEYESGRQGDGPAGAFAPRKAASTVYLVDGAGAHTDLLEPGTAHQQCRLYLHKGCGGGRPQCARGDRGEVLLEGHGGHIHQPCPPGRHLVLAPP